MKNTVMATADHRDTVTGGVSDGGGGVYHPPLPPGYELDDYWMEHIVLKDEKQAEDEFYSAWGRFSKLNHPHPPYVAARIAAAPRYNPFSSLLLTKSQRNKDHGDVGVKRKRNNSDDDHHYYLPCKASGDDQVIKKKPRLIFVFKGYKSSHSSNLSDVHQVKSVSRKTIPVAAVPVPVPATNGVLVLPDREMMIKNLITAKMGVCGSLALVVSKKLTCTDLAQSQNRFSIPHRQVQNDFLTDEEKKFLGREPKPPSGCSTIEVELLILDQQNHLQPPYLDANEIKVRSLNLANWKTNSMYVLKTGWYSLVQQHQLQEGTSVQLWAFRNDRSELCFALLLLN